MKKLFFAVVCAAVLCLFASCSTDSSLVDMSGSSGFDEYEYKYFYE